MSNITIIYLTYFVSILLLYTDMCSEEHNAIFKGWWLVCHPKIDLFLTIYFRASYFIIPYAIYKLGEWA